MFYYLHTLKQINIFYPRALDKYIWNPFFHCINQNIDYIYEILNIIINKSQTILNKTMQPQSYTLSSPITNTTNKSPMSTRTTQTIPFSSNNSFLKRKRKPQNSREWTNEEELQLIKLNELYPHNWRQIARLLKTKTPIQCSYKFEKLSSESKIAKFTRREDIILIELVNKIGKNWDAISKAMHNKYSKEALKRRYFEKLLPGIAKEFSEMQSKEIKKDYNGNKINISINNDYVYFPCKHCSTNVKVNSIISFSYSIINSPFTPNKKQNQSLMINNGCDSSSQSLLSTEPNNERSKRLFIIEKDREFAINEELMQKQNQILRRLYKRLIQIYQVMISLEYSDQSISKATLIERKKELCIQVKNYKFKFNVSTVFSKMHELEETIDFARKKINYYLDINKYNTQ